MSRINAVASLFFLGAAVFGLSPAAKADQWNEKTKVTFNEPVEIPGMVLPPGTYVFKLMDSQTDRNIVQIFNKDENHLYATILAVPDYRLHPTGKTVIHFEERPAGSPEAIRAWFYPGDNYGQEFVYPKSRATELSKAAKQPVLSMPSEMAENIAKPATSVTEPSVMAMKKAPMKAQQPGGEEVEIAEVVTPPPAAPMQQQAKRLPKGASELPLFGLAGLLSLAIWGGVRYVNRRAA
jgi:hypothetical protein